MMTATLAPTRDQQDLGAPTPRSTSSGKRRHGAAAGLRYLLLAVFAILVLMPLYVLVVTSLKPASMISADQAWRLPGQLSIAGWTEAWGRLSPSLYRSLILAVSAAVLSSILGSLNGFVFARWRFPGSTIVFTVFLFGMFIPYQAVMIPLQGMLLSASTFLPWLEGIPRLILVHTVYGIPICTLIFRNYYATAVPVEILEAARVDGAGMLRTYASIILPVSIPGFVVALIWQFTSAWNDFLFALFLTNAQNGPVTYVLNELAGGQNPNYASIMAGVLVASLPTLLVYVLLGRWFISGLMSGSVK